MGFVATLIRDIGVARGERVAILKRNHFDVHLFAAAVVRAGGVACPMSSQFHSSDVRPYIDHIGARVLISDVETLCRILAAGGSVGVLGTIIIAAKKCESDRMQSTLTTGLLSQLPNVRLVWLEDALVNIHEEAPAVRRCPAEPLYLVHSSGTTGFPKAVILTNAAQSHAVRGWLCYVHLSRSHDRGLLAVPNNHQAVILTFNSALLLGLPIHWTSACTREDFNPERVAHTLAEGRYTGFFAFPIAYTLLKELDWSKYDVSGIRFWASTADAAHMAIQRVFVEQGRAFRSLGLPLRGSVYLDAQGSSEVGTPSVLRYVTAYTRKFDRASDAPGQRRLDPPCALPTTRARW